MQKFCRADIQFKIFCMIINQKLVQSHQFYRWPDRFEDTIVHRRAYGSRRKEYVTRPHVRASDFRINILHWQFGLDHSIGHLRVNDLSTPV